MFAAEPVPDSRPPNPGRGGGRELRPAAVRVRHRGHAARAAHAHPPRHRRVPAARRAGPVAAGSTQVRTNLPRYSRDSKDLNDAVTTFRLAVVQNAIMKWFKNHLMVVFLIEIFTSIPLLILIKIVTCLLF